MADDNVIPFPTRPTPAASDAPAASPPDPAEIARQLLAAGHSPQDLVAAISAAAMRVFEPPRLQPPSLRPRRDRVAQYIIRVDLDGSKPKIWRRIVVPSDLPLERLHDVLQAAMGWTDSHLHAFRMDTGRRRQQSQSFLTAFDIEEGEEGTPEAGVRLDETLADVGQQLWYEYDFGDGWDHTLKLEAVDAMAQDEPVETQVTGGRRACPPEDVGGMYSYNELVAVLGGAASDDDWMREKIAWLPDGFDPAAFDLGAASQAAADAAAGRTTAYALPFVHPELVEMLRALGPLSPLDELLDEAATGPAELSAAEAAAAVGPLMILLDLVGTDGAELTSAGYLKPALVEQLARDTGITKNWIGKANREDLTPPVANLRATAQALGLLRKSRQRLVLSRVGLRVRQDPPELWAQLVAALPAGKRPEQRQAGLVALLVAAAGRPATPFTLGGEVLTNLGWRVDDGPISDWSAYEAARPTRQVLEVLAPGEFRRLAPAAAVLARAALIPAPPSI